MLRKYWILQRFSRFFIFLIALTLDGTILTLFFVTTKPKNSILLLKIDTLKTWASN